MPRRARSMTDVLVVAVVIAFFAAATEADEAEGDSGTDDQPQAADSDPSGQWRS
jgi:hypothetical protein